MGGTSVTLKGFADRIDQRGKGVSILDYKSGQSHATTFKTIGDLFTDTNKKHIFQLFFYMLLYKYRSREDFPKDRFPDTLPEAGIIYLRDVLKGADPTHFASQSLTKKEQAALAAEGKGIPTPEELVQEFENLLKIYIKDILETEKFAQTSDLKHCKYCDYTLVCQRKPKDFSVL